MSFAPERGLRELRPALLRVQPGTRERARLQVVRLVLLIYLLAICEGALRKWVAPQYSQYIFFVRDPFLLLTYALATLHGLWPRRSPWFVAVMAMAALGVLLALLQVAIGGLDDIRLILAVHGYRSYFLYVPLAFLIGAQFRRADLLRVYRLTLWLAIPVAILVTLQFFSPPNAPINVGIAAEKEFQFRGLTVTAERTRPMGPFASGAGQNQFTATAWAVALGLFMSAAALRRMSLLVLALCTGAVLVSLGLGGSRGAMLQCGMSVLFAGVLGLLARGAAQKGRALVWAALLATVAIVLYPVLLPEGFQSFTQRWETAAAAESRSFESGVFGRAAYGLVDFVRLLDEVPALGYGLGYGSNASNTLRASVDGVMPSQLAETDFSRHMVDLGPVFGVGYIVFRLALATHLTLKVLQVTQRVADPMPMLLLSYVGITVLSAQITGQGAVNVYAWLFCGFLLAACREALAGAPAARPVARPVARAARPQRRLTTFKLSRNFR